MQRRAPKPEAVQRRMTFLRNHRDAIAAMDFFVVPTITFRLLYVWFVIEHRRRLQRLREMTQVCSAEVDQVVTSDRRAGFRSWWPKTGSPGRTGTLPTGGARRPVKDGRSPPPRGASAASVLDGAEYVAHLVLDDVRSEPRLRWEGAARGGPRVL